MQEYPIHQNITAGISVSPQLRSRQISGDRGKQRCPDCYRVPGNSNTESAVICRLPDAADLVAVNGLLRQINECLYMGFELWMPSNTGTGLYHWARLANTCLSTCSWIFIRFCKQHLLLAEINHGIYFSQSQLLLAKTN